MKKKLLERKILKCIWKMSIKNLKNTTVMSVQKFHTKYWIERTYLAWSAPFLKTFENMRKLDFFRLPAPRCASMAAGAGNLKKI